MKLSVRGVMPSSTHALFAVSAVAMTALMGVPAVDAVNKPFTCPGSKYSALVEDYLSGSDFEYRDYTGLKAPSNWDIESCGLIYNAHQPVEGPVFPGPIHIPPQYGTGPVVPLFTHIYSGWGSNPSWDSKGHWYDWQHLMFHATGQSIPTYLSGGVNHPWHIPGGLDWNGDGVVDWWWYGAGEIAAVRECRNKWWNNIPSNKKLRESFIKVKAHRARNCKNDPSPQMAAYTGDHSPLDKFEQFNVQNSHQRRMTLSVLSKPAIQNVKYIAFFVNGMESCKGYPQSATGSDDGWKINIENRDNTGKCNNKPKRDPHEGYKWLSGDMYISKHSLVGQFMSAPGSPNTYGEDLSVFPVGETLIVNIPDLAYGYPGMPALYNMAGAGGMAKMVKRCNVKNSFNENDQILKAWIAWLDYKVNWDNIKGVYGAGVSRGGCFVTQLTDRLFQGKLKGKGAKLILSTLDPVCAPSELDDYRYKTGFTRDAAYLTGAIASILFSFVGGAAFWTAGDKSVLAGSPLANLGDDMEIRYPVNWMESHKNWREQNQCHVMKLHKMFGDTPREDIRWLNTVTGENVLGGKVDWTGIYSFCSHMTMGPATNIHTGQIVSNLHNDNIDDQLAEDIKPRGPPGNWINRFTRNEDGNPIGNGLKFQNLWLKFDNSAYVSGPTDQLTVNPISWQSVSTTWDSTTGWPTNPPNPVPLPFSNNPMPNGRYNSPACGSWYKQAWTPYNHMTTTGGLYLNGNPDADGVGVPCPGQSSCGYGIHEPQNPDGSFPMPKQKRGISIKNCVPHPRADLDFVYKHMKHAHEAVQELFFPDSKPCGYNVSTDSVEGGHQIGPDRDDGVSDSEDAQEWVNPLTAVDKNDWHYTDSTDVDSNPESGFDASAWQLSDSTDVNGNPVIVSWKDLAKQEQDDDERWTEGDKDEDGIVHYYDLNEETSSETRPAKIVSSEEEIAFVEAQIAKYAEIDKEVNERLGMTDEKAAAMKEDGETDSFFGKIWEGITTRK